MTYKPVGVDEDSLFPPRVEERLLTSPNVRKAALTLSAPNTTNPAAALDFTFRTLVRMPFGVSRWRFGIRNANLRAIGHYTSPMAVTGLYVGSPTYGTTTASGSRWVGNCTAALTQVDPGFSVPTDGTRGWSSWIESADFIAGVDTVISWGQTVANSGSGYAYGNALQGIRAAGSSNAGNATLTTPLISTSVLIGDIVIEYEFSEAAQCGLFIGDSNTITYIQSAPAMLTGANAGALPSESWPALASELGRFVAVNLGVGSASPSDFATNFPNVWDRLPLGDYEFDFAVVSLGTNELSPTGLDAFVANINAINAKLRNLYGIRRIFWTTITPRGNTTLFGRLAASALAGATTISSTYNAPNGTILVGSGPNAEQVTVSGTTGSGPYTLTVSALVNAHSANEPVTSGTEMGRRLYNNFIRQAPAGINGVPDFEKALEAAPDDPSCDPRYVASDALHFQRSASLVKAQTVVAAGVAPKFS